MLSVASSPLRASLFTDPVSTRVGNIDFGMPSVIKILVEHRLVIQLAWSNDISIQSVYGSAS
jgi:hypothetical protein